MKDHAIAIDWHDLIGPVKSYYSTGGNLDSMAFNASTAILYYNRDLFEKAGLPDKAPTTWDELETMAKKLQRAGVKCPFGSAWPSFVLVENMHAYHDQPFTDHSNGFDGPATSLKINGPFGVKIMELLARGAKEGWFTYGGRLNKGEALMTAGECGIIHDLLGLRREPRREEVHVGERVPAAAGGASRRATRSSAAARSGS